MSDIVSILARVNRVLISAERYNRDDNTERTELLRECLVNRNVRHKEIKRCYMGNTEVSFLCSWFDDAFRLGHYFQQESLLVLDALDNAYLVGLNGDVCYVGKFQEVTKDKALESDCYSIIDNKYFLAV